VCCLTVRRPLPPDGPRFRCPRVGAHLRLEEGHSGVLDAFPRLRAIVDNVAQRPRVRTWLSTRVKREQALGNYIDWLL